MMDLRKTLTNEHSKASTDSIIRWIGNSQKRFDELFSYFTGQDARLSQVSGWPLSNCVMANPAFISKHWDKLLVNFSRKGNHTAVKRNTLRLMQDLVIPEKFHGHVMTICFELVSCPDEKPAVKAFALTILDNLIDTYPEIRDELITIIEARWPFETAAFRSRAKRIIARKTATCCFPPVQP